MYITIEGPIGIGKTTLTEMIAQNYGYKTVHEIVEENPFLSKFYDNNDKWAFQTEMFFLTNRYVQLNALYQTHLCSDQNVVADYNIHKNLIFAKKNLNGGDYQKFIEVFDTLTSDIKLPDIVIFLKGDLETLKRRINIRGRSFEQDMDEEYLVSLISAYEEYANDYKQMFPDNYIELDCSRCDYLYNIEDRDFVKKLVTDKIMEVENARSK